MALIKSVDTLYGITADYWRVDTITIDKRNMEANFVLGLYMNKQAVNSLDYKVYTIADKENRDELFDKYFSDSREYTDIYNACYQCAKEQDEFFSDAVDDAEELLRHK